MAMELGDKCWKLVFSDGGEKRRRDTMEAGHRRELVEAIRKAKEKFDLSSEAKVVSCYEAGRDGFWLQRSRPPIPECVDWQGRSATATGLSVAAWEAMPLAGIGRMGQIGRR
jgi:hypothetical protein